MAERELDVSAEAISAAVRLLHRGGYLLFEHCGVRYLTTGTPVDINEARILIAQDELDQRWRLVQKSPREWAGERR